MAYEKNYTMLANLIRKVAGTEEGKTPEDTIKIATKFLKKHQKFDFDLTRRLKKAGLSEEEIADKKDQLFEWSEYIEKRFAGEPSVKNWAHLNFVEKGIFQPLQHGGDFKAEDEYNAKEAEDNDFDKENGVTYSDIDNFVDNMNVDDYINSVYDPEDFEEFDEFEEEKEDELEESLSRAARIKKRNAMKRFKGIIARKREISLKKHATMDIIKKRARKLAIRMLKQKYSKKVVGDMSVAERERVEKLLSNKSALLDRMTTKMIPVVRKIEQERFNKKAKKE